MIWTRSENYWKRYVAKKHIVSKLSNIWILNFSNTNWRLQWRLCQNFTSLYFYTFSRNKQSMSVTVGSRCFIILNYSGSLKMVMKMYFIFFLYKKVLDFLKRFYSSLNVINMTHIWLIKGTSIASLTYNYYSIFIIISFLLL